MIPIAWLLHKKKKKHFIKQGNEAEFDHTLKIGLIDQWSHSLTANHETLGLIFKLAMKS